MLRLERESEIETACLYRLGYPGLSVVLLCRGKDSNLHWDRFFRLNFSVSLRSSREPVLSPARAFRAPPRSHAGAIVDATRGPCQPNR
jgi:hypothetical protein